MIKIFQIRYIILFITLSCFGNNQTVQASNNDINEIGALAKPGPLRIKQLLDACPAIANAMPSQPVAKSIANKIITIDHKNYKINFFNFEDVQNQLPNNMLFKDYLFNNNLLDLRSIETNPLPDIRFQSFCFREAHSYDKTSFNVYFGVVLRIVNEMIRIY